MRTFLSASVCNGSFPPQVHGSRFFNRNALLSAMMSDRGRVRYLLAPSCFGKTALACTYAQINYEFNDTSWISAKSPCFLRDLDSGVIASETMRLIDEQGLVVFDDVPALSEHRSRLLWEACTALVRSGREVVVCTTPGADPFARFHASCVVVEPESFLYSDAEMRLLEDEGALTRRWFSSPLPLERVAGLIGKGEHTQERFFCDVLADSSDEQGAVLFAMLMMESGTFDELESVCGGQDGMRALLTQRSFPYLSIEVDAQHFAAQGFSLKAIMRAFQPHVHALSLACGIDDTQEFALRLAKVLGRKGAYERLAHVLVRLCSPSSRARWLHDCQEEVADAGSLVALEEVYQSLAGHREKSYAELAVASAARRLLLGEGEAALNDLLRIARRPELGWKVRLKAASAAYILAEDGEAVMRALDDEDSLSGIEYSRDTAGVPKALRAMWLNPDEASDTLSAVLDVAETDSGPATTCALACALRNCPHVPTEEQDRAKRAVKRCAGDVTRVHVLTVSGLLLVREAAACGLVDRSIDQVAVRAIEERLRVERSAYAHVHPSLITREVSLTDPANSDPARIRTIVSIPRLTVQLFGRFCISHDAEMIDESRLNRAKARALLTMLVIDAGRDISCERLAAALWPESSRERARHNFSNALGDIRNAIALADGECPYITRTQNIVRLRSDLVQSDVGTLFDLCRALSRERHEPEAMREMLDQMRTIYVGELLPGNLEDLPIKRARVNCRNSVVDAALRAVGWLIDSGEMRFALPFARQALEWDPDREDCYEVLMTLQSRTGQRPAAIDTWQAYVARMRRLGIDPSLRMQKLYMHILNGDDM